MMTQKKLNFFLMALLGLFIHVSDVMGAGATFTARSVLGLSNISARQTFFKTYAQTIEALKEGKSLVSRHTNPKVEFKMADEALKQTRKAIQQKEGELVSYWNRNVLGRQVLQEGESARILDEILNGAQRVGRFETKPERRGLFTRVGY